MPQKNIYIKTEDLKLFKKAEDFGESISAVISKALDNYLNVLEKRKKGFKEYYISCDGLVYYFFARLLVELRNTDGAVCKIFQTKGDNFVFVCENNAITSIKVYKHFHEVIKDLSESEKEKLLEALKEKKIVFIE